MSIKLLVLLKNIIVTEIKWFNLPKNGYSSVFNTRAWISVAIVNKLKVFVMLKTLHSIFHTNFPLIS